MFGLELQVANRKCWKRRREMGGFDLADGTQLGEVPDETHGRWRFFRALGGRATYLAATIIWQRSNRSARCVPNRPWLRKFASFPMM
jgi:hypothetical protein